MCLVAFGFFALGKKSNSKAQTSINYSANYNLLSKRIFIENGSEINVNFSNLRQQLNDYFAKNKLDGGNLYFEYLPTGTSIRISGNEQLVAASLMKIPVAMNAYKLAENGNIDLNEQVTLKPEWLDNNYGDLYKKGAGYKLTLEEAIKIMLENSDNTALNAVASETEGKLSQKESSLSYLDLDLTFNKDQSISIDSRSYSSFLKCLYFSCYNNLENSQKILGYLTNSTSNNRLVAGVPVANFPIAHKIGTNSNLNQSDCGIFYVPRKNYVVCVMIPGPDSNITNKHFEEISRITYRYIEGNSTEQ